MPISRIENLAEESRVIERIVYSAKPRSSKRSPPAIVVAPKTPGPLPATGTFGVGCGVGVGEGVSPGASVGVGVLVGT